MRERLEIKHIIEAYLSSFIDEAYQRCSNLILIHLCAQLFFDLVHNRSLTISVDTVTEAYRLWFTIEIYPSLF
jgi:hypothetical protein